MCECVYVCVCMCECVYVSMCMCIHVYVHAWRVEAGVYYPWSDSWIPCSLRLEQHTLTR